MRSSPLPTLACLLLLGVLRTSRAHLDCESVVPSICALNGAGVHCHPCSNAAFVVCSGPQAPGEVQACEPGHQWHAFFARCQPRSSQQQQQQQQQQPEGRCLPGVNLQVPGAFLLGQQQQQQDAALMAASSTTTSSSSSSSSSSSWSGWAPLVGAFASKQQRTARVNLRLHLVRNPDSSSSAMNAAAVGVSPGQGTGEQLPAARTGAASNDPTAGVVAELLAMEAAARQLGSGASPTGDGITAAYVDAGFDGEPFELFVDFSEEEEEDAAAGGAVAAAAARPRLAQPAEALTLPGSSSSRVASSGLAQPEANPFGEEAAARAEAAADENSSSSSAVADAPMDVVQRFIEEVVAAAPDTAEGASSSTSSVVADSQWRGGVEEFDAELVAQLNSALLDIDAEGQ